MADAIKRHMRRRWAVEPVIGHMKAGHRVNRNDLAHAADEANNTVFAAVGNNFRRLPAWLALWHAVVLCTLRTNQRQAVA